MDSTELTHKMFLSALDIKESVGSNKNSGGFTAGCRCRTCYSLETSHQGSQCLTVSKDNLNDHRTISERVPGLGRLFLEEPNDFASFFYGKIASRYACADERERTELDNSSIVYSRNCIESLYRDLEYTHINHGWNNLDALAKLFQNLNYWLRRSTALEWRGFAISDIRVPLQPTVLFESSRNPGPGLMFSERYEANVDPREDLVRSVCLAGNIGLLDELLKFGGTMFKPHSDCQYELYRVKEVIMFLLEYDEQVGHLGEEYFLRAMATRFEPPARRRLFVSFVIMLGLEVLLKVALWIDDYEDCYKMCLRRIFEAIPEPHIRSCEIRDCLTKLLPPEGKDKIEDLANGYESLFPESTGKVTPRSLKHLSRVRIRQCFKEHGCFIKEMLHLDLPRSVKRYLDLDLHRSKNPTFFYLDTFWYGADGLKEAALEFPIVGYNVHPNRVLKV